MCRRTGLGGPEETLLGRVFGIAQHIAFRRRIRTLVDMVTLSFTEPQVSPALLTPFSFGSRRFTGHCRVL